MPIRRCVYTVRGVSVTLPYLPSLPTNARKPLAAPVSAPVAPPTKERRGPHRWTTKAERARDHIRYVATMRRVLREGA